MLKKVLFVICIIFIASCENISSQVIILDTMKNDLIKVQEKIELKDYQLLTFETLIAISEGRESYISFRELDDDISQIVIPENAFNKNVDIIQNILIDNQVTYDLFIEKLESFKDAEDKYKEEMQPIYKEIDLYSVQAQSDIDQEEKEIKLFNDELHNMINVEVISIANNKIDYIDNATIELKLTNNTDKKVEAFLFGLKLYDKLEREIVELYCSSNNSFTSEDIRFWNYDKYKRSDEYYALRHLQVDHISKVLVEVYNINLSGEILKEKSVYSELGFNFEYETPEPLYGYSPYVKEGNPLYIEEKNKEKLFLKSIEENHSLVNNIQELIYNFMDYDRL